MHCADGARGIDRWMEMNESDGAIGEERICRFIRSTSHHGKEQTLLFARDEGSRTSLFVVDFDGSEMDVVEVSVAPDRLNDTISKYEHRNGDGEKSN